MKAEERKALAEQILGNPLFNVLMDELEHDAVERMVAAPTDLARMEAQAYVRAARSFRANCEAQLRNTGSRKAAPA